MTVVIKRGLATRIREYPDSILIQAAEPSDAARAGVAMTRAGEQILRLDGGPGSAYGLGPGDRNNPKWVSEVLQLPGGPMMMIDGGSTPRRLLAAIPQIVADCLEEDGVAAIVRAPDVGGPLSETGQILRAVVLRMYTLPHAVRERVELPQGWLGQAGTWVLGQAPPDTDVMGRLQYATFDADGAAVEGLLEQWERVRPGMGVLATGDPAGVMRAAGLYLTPDQNINIALGLGGPGASDQDLIAGFAELQVVAREIAGAAAYAFISIEATFGAFSGPWHDTEWAALVDGPRAMLAEAMADRIVLDAFPYQILGPAHLQTFPEAPSGAVALSAGRLEVVIGAPQDWLFARQPDPNWDPRAQWSALRQDPAVALRGRDVLAPWLMTSDQARSLLSDTSDSPTSTGSEQQTEGECSDC
jgi:hypothetical protein